MDPFTRPRRATHTANYAVALMVGGAAIVVIGSAAAWYQLSGATQIRSATGTSLDVGWLSIGMTVFVGVCALLVFLRARRTGGRGWSITATVVAAFIALFGLAVAADPASSYASFRASKIATTEPGVDRAVLESAIRLEIADGSLVVRAADGAWAVFLGGLLALAGAIMAVAMARSFRGPAPIAPVPAYWQTTAAWGQPSGPPPLPPPPTPRDG